MVQYMEEAGVLPETLPTKSGRPWHLWVVGGLSLLWNLIGAADYTFTHLDNRTWIGAAANNMGVSVEDMLAYIDSFPAWMHGFWALGVWGAVIGSILLLMRSRYALWSFAVSLLGLAVTQFYRILAPRPDWVGEDVAMNLLLWSVATFLVIYAVSMRRRRVLR